MKTRKSTPYQGLRDFIRACFNITDADELLDFVQTYAENVLANAEGVESKTKAKGKLCFQCEQPSNTSPCENCQRLNKKWDKEEK